jgi:hypothetical protein
VVMNLHVPVQSERSSDGQTLNQQDYSHVIDSNNEITLEQTANDKVSNDNTPSNLQKNAEK